MLHLAVNDIDLSQALGVFHSMREELMAGQYLDVLEGALGKSDRARSLKVAEYKSGKYSIERPLHFGAALAGKLDAYSDVYSKFGIPLGVGFQLRDDLLGVFGDEQVTGKPSGDDIREGKRTVLIAIAQERLSQKERSELDSYLNEPTLGAFEIQRAQELIEDSGARRECELLIESCFQDALLALEHESLPVEISEALAAMATLATKRSS
jgi:geranylgeranyl diphosphate synthase type I